MRSFLIILSLLVLLASLAACGDVEQKTVTYKTRSEETGRKIAGHDSGMQAQISFMRAKGWRYVGQDVLEYVTLLHFER